MEKQPQQWKRLVDSWTPVIRDQECWAPLVSFPTTPPAPRGLLTKFPNLLESMGNPRVLLGR